MPRDKKPKKDNQGQNNAAPEVSWTEVFETEEEKSKRRNEITQIVVDDLIDDLVNHRRWWA